MALHNLDPSEWLESMAETAGPNQGAEPPAELRRTLLRRSTRVVRRRRCLRRFSLVGALAVCYLAGLASSRLPTLVSPNGPTTIAHSNDTNPGATAGLPSATGSASANQENTTDSASADPSIENATADSTQSTPPKKLEPPSRFERLRRLSDRYLYERGDVTTAIRYYRKALAVATEEELAIALDSDSWLLIALKQERIQEKRYANQST